MENQGLPISYQYLLSIIVLIAHILNTIAYYPWVIPLLPHPLLPLLVLIPHPLIQHNINNHPHHSSILLPPHFVYQIIILLQNNLLTLNSHIIHHYHPHLHLHLNIFLSYCFLDQILYQINPLIITTIPNLPILVLLVIIVIINYLNLLLNLLLLSLSLSLLLFLPFIGLPLFLLILSFLDLIFVNCFLLKHFSLIPNHPTIINTSVNPKFFSLSFHHFNLTIQLTLLIIAHSEHILLRYFNFVNCAISPLSLILYLTNFIHLSLGPINFHFINLTNFTLIILFLP